MRVLIACEYSGIVREAFKAKGYNAWSCDFLDSDLLGKHIKGDVIKVLNDGWDLMVAFPPCTDLAVSGAHSFYRKEKEQKEALDFVNILMSAKIPKIAIENPVGVISSHIRKPDQIIQPYYFGDAVSKKTCLWLKNLIPLLWFEPGCLFPSSKVEPEYLLYNSKKTKSGFSKYSYQGKMGKGKGHYRSKTFPGVAFAMAETWGYRI